MGEHAGGGPTPEELREAMRDHAQSPESVELSKREQERRLERERRNNAAEARKARLKADGPPSGIEDVCADMVRVAEDEFLNPRGFEFRTLTRQRYEWYGRFYIHEVEKFGTFQHVKSIAGLNAMRAGHRRLLRARTNADKAQRAEEYVEREILPYIDRFPELERETSGAKLVAFISDTHGFFADPAAVLSFMDFLRDAQPDHIIFGGDHMDCTEISTHPPVPGWTIPLQMEFDHQNAFIREAFAAAPNAKGSLVESNHGPEVRMVKYLTQKGRGICSLRGIELSNLLELDDLPLQLAFRRGFLTRRNVTNSAAVRLWGKIAGTHGTFVGPTAQMKELEHWGMSGMSGHLHGAAMTFGKKAALRDMVWSTSPGATIDEVARYYIPGNGPSWQTGWQIAELFRGQVRIHHAIVRDGAVSVNGWRWQWKGKKPLPTTKEDTMAFWVDRYKIKRESYE
jgi:hypothetical protein